MATLYDYVSTTSKYRYAWILVVQETVQKDPFQYQNLLIFKTVR